MSVEDWGSTKRWLVERSKFGDWWVYPPEVKDAPPAEDFDTFTEAHAAYLDAVTCPDVCQVGSYEIRCGRSRGHERAHFGSGLIWNDQTVTLTTTSIDNKRCEAMPPFASWDHCEKISGHAGQHVHPPIAEGLTPLIVNPK